MRPPGPAAIRICRGLLSKHFWISSCRACPERFVVGRSLRQFATWNRVPRGRASATQPVTHCSRRSTSAWGKLCSQKRRSRVLPRHKSPYGVIPGRRVRSRVYPTSAVRRVAALPLTSPADLPHGPGSSPPGQPLFKPIPQTRRISRPSCLPAEVGIGCRRSCLQEARHMTATAFSRYAGNPSFRCRVGFMREVRFLPVPS
jgi:hypothetical protein